MAIRRPSCTPRPDYNARKSGESTGSGDQVSAAIAQGLGGAANIKDVDCCATRLRCTVIDGSKVDQAILKSTGAAGVVQKGQGVQVVYGPQVNIIKANLEDYLRSGAAQQAAPAVEAAPTEEPARRRPPPMARWSRPSSSAAPSTASPPPSPPLPTRPLPRR